MNQDTFYLLDSRYANVNFMAAPIKYPKGIDRINLELGFTETGLEKDYVIFKQIAGKRLVDFLDTGLCSIYLISSPLKRFLESNHITGWKSYHIKLLDKKDNEIQGYHGFSVIGRCGIEVFSKSAIFKKQYVPKGPYINLYKGINFKLDDWDGSDIFIPKGQFGIYCTGKVVKLLKTHKFTNIRFTSQKEIITEEYIVDKISETQKRNMKYFES